MNKSWVGPIFLALLLNGTWALGDTDAGLPGIELLRTLEARGAFISLNGQFLFLTSAVDTKSQQQAEAGCWFDIGPDPVSPARISAALPAAWQVAVAGDHALVCDYTKFLTIYDIRDRQWTSAAKLPMPAQTENVVIRKNFAYIANHVAGLTIVDIATPSEPSIVSNFNPGIDCDAVALWRDCAILYGHWESRLVLADVSDPANPRQIGLYQHEPKTFNQGEVEVANGFAYCTGVNSLVIVNIADPANPRLAKAVPFKGAITDVVLRDEYAFVAGNDGIQVLDVTDPANPLAVGHFAQPSFQLAVAVAEPPAPKGDYHIYATSKKRPPVVLRFRAPSGQPPVPGQ